MYILNYIAAIPDPRQDYKVEYPLSTLLFTTLCAVLCGCQSWQEVSDYCEAKKERVVIKIRRSKYGYSISLDI